MKTCLYKGREFKLLRLVETRRGLRAKLGSLADRSRFWVDASLLTFPRMARQEGA